MIFRTIIGLLLVSAYPAAAQDPRTLRDSLAGITDRGRLLAAYDQAAWHATDAVMMQAPASEEIRGYIAIQQNGAWTVLFGRVSNDEESFLVAYEANENSNEQNGFSVKRHAPAKLEKGDIAARARALDLARADFGVPTRSYNAAILPAGNGEWFVYLMPAQTRPDVFPLGGDVRYRVSADGRRILIKRRLHNSILEYAEPAPSEKGKPVARFHTAVLDEIPEDTDVFHVLVRRPRVPEYVLTDKYVYRIDISGQIGGAGSRKDVLGPDGQLRIR